MTKTFWVLKLNVVIFFSGVMSYIKSRGTRGTEMSANAASRPYPLTHIYVHYSKKVRKLEMFGAIFYFILKIIWYLIYHTYYHSFVDIDAKF